MIKALYNHIDIDQLNIIMMIIALAVAYYIPVELVLISYAFLGPAHYLTQISWMHDRAYFTGSNFLLWAFVLLSLAFTFMYYLGVFNTIYYAYMLCAALSIAMSYVFFQTTGRRFTMSAIFFAVMIGLVNISPGFSLTIGVFLPTILHIYVFTLLFMLYGAMKTGSPWAYLSCLMMVICAAYFFILEPESRIYFPEMTHANIGPFAVVADHLQRIFSFGGHVSGVSMLGMLSFAYTYHYLNWFTKVNIIQWNQIPKRRIGVMVLLYLMTISLYLYDYRIGFLSILFLSLLHVLLELPLNVMTIRAVASRILGILK